MEDKKERLITPSKLVFYGLCLLAFYLAIRYMGKLEDIKSLLAQMNFLWIIVILCLQTATYVFYALVIRVLLWSKTDQKSIALYTLSKMAVVLVFMNQALPSGGISGNGFLFGQLIKRKMGSLKAFRALIMESISYYLAFMITLGLIYLLFRHSKYYAMEVPAVTYTTLTGFIFFSFLGAIMLLLNNKRSYTFINRKLHRFSLFRKYIEQIKVPIQEEGTASIENVRVSSSPFFKAVLFQTCLILCDILTVYCLLYAFHIHIPPLLVILAVLLSTVIGSLPVSPGSLIVYETAMTYFLTWTGVPVHAAIIVTLLYRFFTFWLPIPMGLLLYRKLHR